MADNTAQMTVRAVASDAQLTVNILAGDNVVWAWGDDKDFVVKLTSAVVAADAEPDASVYVGTSDHQGTAANSVVLSNVTLNGDVQGLVNNGGNSLEWLLVDASAKTITLGWGLFDTLIANGAGLVIGHTAQVDLTIPSLTPEFQVLGTTRADASMMAAMFSTDAVGATLFLVKSKIATIGGTPSAALVADDVVGVIEAIGSNFSGGDIRSQAGKITFAAESTWVAGASPSYMSFATTDASSQLATERVRVTSIGRVGINTTVPQSLLDIQGAAGAAGILTLATKELTVVDGDVLGRINFNAPLESDGGDAILVGAAIWAEATATFSATVNTTDLVFAVGVSEAATEKMRLDSAGTLWVSSEADSTTAARGIAFGLSKDTNLYRSAANTLKTDDNVAVGLKVTSYNDVATVGWGVPAVYGTGRATAQAAAVATVATYTVGAADGTFVVTANVLVTTATNHNFTIIVTYTDEASAAQTLTLSLTNLAGTTLTAITNANGAVPYMGIGKTIRCKAATAITIATTGTFTTVTYNVEGHILQIA